MYSNEDYFGFASAVDGLLSGELPAMMPLMRRLFPICRSLTGEGVRQTLDILGESIPLARERVATGTKCFDWEVPREWNIRDAYVKNPAGERVIDFRKSNLHVVGYSVPVRRRLSLGELQEHLHSMPDYPEAIPYRASYYNEAWGFCLTHEQREALPDATYEVLIDSGLEPGHLDYAQALLPGAGDREVFFSTYVCHPSLANNELSGPVLVSTLFGLLRGLPRARRGYRALFAPETIGAIVFLSRHHEELRAKLDAGYVVTCAGDDGPFNLKRSKRGGTLADRAAEHVLRHPPRPRQVIVRDFDPVGSDERQYCSPGIDLPVASLMRSRYGEYREYHTSRDDLDFVSEEGLRGSLEAYLRVVQTIELNCTPTRTNPYCEPQLGRRGLYSKLVTSGVEGYVVKLLNILCFADGEHDLIAIAERIGCPVWELRPLLEKLVEADLIRLNLGAG
jgi:aminopeptidase-like protein